MSEVAIVEAFQDLPDPRRTAGQRHGQALCLALFTLAVAAGNRGFLAIGDWLKAYYDDLVRLFNPPKGRLPSYSTIRRVLLKVDYEQYSACLARFFAIKPQPGETIAADGKVLRGSYQLESDNPDSEPHPAIMLVSAYIVERGLILEPVRCGLENKRYHCLAGIYSVHGTPRGGVCLRCHQYPKKTCQVIVSSGNDYIGALKGNQSGLLSAVERQFQPEQTVQQINKGHGR